MYMYMCVLAFFYMHVCIHAQMCFLCFSHRMKLYFAPDRPVRCQSNFILFCHDLVPSHRIESAAAQASSCAFFSWSPFRTRRPITTYAKKSMHLCMVANCKSDLGGVPGGVPRVFQGVSGSLKGVSGVSKASKSLRFPFRARNH